MKIYLNKFIEFQSAGIKCDNPSCNFKDNTVKLEDHQQWLNKPCPKCGQNLLTPKDMQTVEILKKIEKYTSWIRLPSFKPPKEVHANMNGSGKIEYQTEPTYAGVIISCLWMVFFGYAIYYAMSHNLYLFAFVAILCYYGEMKLMYNEMISMRQWKTKTLAEKYFNKSLDNP